MHPSRVILPSDSPADPAHSVTSYSTTSAELTLQHKFPKINEVKAFVDVRLLLEKLTAEQTCVGHWLNVIGYIASSSTFSVKKQHNLKLESPTVHVQALMLWSAGPLDIGRYETCVADVAEKGTPKAKRRKTNPS